MKVKFFQTPLNQCFTSLLTRNEPLFNFFKDYVFTILGCLNRCNSRVLKFNFINLEKVTIKVAPN